MSPARPFHIEPSAIYSEGAIALMLDISLAAIGRARREGELPFVRRGRRVFILGRDLLEWLTPKREREECRHAI